MSSFEDDHLPPLPPAPAMHHRSLSTQSIPASDPSSSPSASPHHSPARRSPPLSRSSSTNSSPRSPLSPRRSAPDSPRSLGRSSSSRSPTFPRSPELTRRSSLATGPPSTSSAGSSSTPSRHIRSSSLLAKVSPSLGASARYNGSIASVGLRSPGLGPGLRTGSSDRMRERELLRQDERRRTQSGASAAELPEGVRESPLGLGIGGFAKGLGNLPSPPTTASDGGSHGKADGARVRPLTEAEGGSPIRPERPPRNEARTPMSRRMGSSSTSSDFEIPEIQHQSPTLTYSSPNRPPLGERRSSSLVSSSLVMQAEMTNITTRPRMQTSDSSESPPGSRRGSGTGSSALQRTASASSARRHSQTLSALSFTPSEGRSASPSSAARSPTASNPSPLHSPSLRNSIGSLPDRPISAASGSDSGASTSRRTSSAASQRTLPAGDTSDQMQGAAEARRQRRSSKIASMRDKNDSIFAAINSQAASPSVQSPVSQQTLSPQTPNFTSPPNRHLGSEVASPLAARQFESPASGRSTPRRSEILQRTLRSARSTLDEFGTPSSSGSVSRRSSTMGLLASGERDRERDAERERRARTLGERGSGGRRSDLAEEWTGGRLDRARAGSIEEQGPARSYTSMGDYPVSPEQARRREAQSDIIRPVSSFSSTAQRDEQLAGHLRRLGSREGLHTSPRDGKSRRAGSDAFLLERLGKTDELPDSPALAGATKSPEVRHNRPGLPREFLGGADRQHEHARSQTTDLSPRTAFSGRFSGEDRSRLGSPRLHSPRASSPLRFPSSEAGERVRKTSTGTARSGASEGGEERRASGASYVLPSPRATRGVGSGGSSVSSGTRSAYRSGRQDSISEVNEDGSPMARAGSRLGAAGEGSGDYRDRTLRAVQGLIAAGELRPSDLGMVEAVPPPSRSAPPGHHAGHAGSHVSPRKSESGRASVLDSVSPRVRRLSLIYSGAPGSPALTLGRSGSTASRASGVFGLGSSSGQLEHQRNLDQAFDYFAQHFGSTDPGREVVSPESVDLVRRMEGMLQATGRLNAGLRALAGQAQEAQVAAELGERGGGGEVAQFGRALSGLVRASDDQQRGLTEALMAFVRVERERDKLRREGEQFARPASRASFSVRGTPGGPLHASPKRPQTSSPFEAGNGFTRGPSRQQLRDPLADEYNDLPRRAQTISLSGGRGAYTEGGQGGVDSPTPAGRRGGAHERSPLMSELGARRQSSEASGVDRRGLPLSAPRSSGTLRAGKSSGESQTTARPTSHNTNSIRFPKSHAVRPTVDFGMADSHVSPTRNPDAAQNQAQFRPRTESIASVTSTASRATFNQDLGRSPQASAQTPSTDEDEFYIAPQGLSSPEIEQHQHQPPGRGSSPVQAGGSRLAGVGEKLRSMVTRRKGTNEGVPETAVAVGMGLERVRSRASPEEVRSEARRTREEVVGRILGR